MTVTAISSIFSISYSEIVAIDSHPALIIAISKAATSVSKVENFLGTAWPLGNGLDLLYHSRRQTFTDKMARVFTVFG